MVRRFRTSIFVVLFLFLAGALCLAQDFSADVYDLETGRNMEFHKIFVSGDKVRLETKSSEDMGASAIIWDTVQQKYYVLMASRHMYMEMSRLPQRGFAFWRPTNVNDACPEWKSLAEQLKRADKFGTCRKVGSDTVNGRSAIEYEGTSSDGKKGQVWLDAKLHCLIKAVDEDGGGIELRNIQEGSQPSSLFEIPSGYQKMDMGSMMGGRMAAPPRQ